MKNPMIRFHNVETDEIIDREMTQAEYEVYLAEQAITQAREQESFAKNAAKEALLKRLGITAEEAKLLLS
jgi:3-isopropylmalate dehydratase small subunit